MKYSSRNVAAYSERKTQFGPIFETAKSARKSGITRNEYVDDLQV